VSNLLDQIKQDEGWREHVYQDHLGYDTIGYGFLVDERRGGGMPREVGEFWLRFIIGRLTEELPRRWPAWRDQPEGVQDALLNMAYQLGVTGLLGFAKMLAALEAGDRQKAADEALDSRWASQTPNRARRVAAMIRGRE
jgi:lysozyme